MKKLVLILSILTLGISAIGADLVIDSKTQTYSEHDNKIKFEGNVNVQIDDIKVVGEQADVTVSQNMKPDIVTFYDKPYAYEVKDNKKREVKANILKLSLLNKTIKAQGDSQTIVTDGKIPIAVINADEQEYDTKNNIMIASGSVTIKYKEIETFSDKAIVVTNKKGDLQKIDLIGRAILKEKKNTSYADHFIYSAVTEELTAKGHTKSVSISDNGDIMTLTADYQHYDRKKNTFLGSGQVVITYQDYIARGPKVVFYPDSKTGKPNEMVLVGRSKISQGVRDIHADSIKLTIEPKNFEAVGNVRTVIRNVNSLDDSKEGL